MIDSAKAKLITDIRLKVSAYFDTDDNRLDDDYIWEQALLTRPMFIQKMIEQNKTPHEGFYSRVRLTIATEDLDATIPNPDYHPVNNPNVPQIIPNPDYDPDFPGYRRVSLPPLIKVQNAIRFLGSNDLTHEYNPVGFDGFFHRSGRQWTSDEVHYMAFHDKAFFSAVPTADPVAPATEGVPYTTLSAWVLLEDLRDDPNFDDEIHPIVPSKYQLLLEEMIADRILKYAKTGLLNKTNNATDLDADEQ